MQLSKICPASAPMAPPSGFAVQGERASREESMGDTGEEHLPTEPLGWPQIEWEEQRGGADLEWMCTLSSAARPHHLHRPYRESITSRTDWLPVV